MAEQSWGLTERQCRMVLGIRAAGLLFVGLGVPFLKSIATYVWAYGFARDSGESWDIGTLLDQLRDKAVVVNLVSATGPFIAAMVFGVYLIRCDPRGILRGVNS